MSGQFAGINQNRMGAFTVVDDEGAAWLAPLTLNSHFDETVADPADLFVPARVDEIASIANHVADTSLFIRDMSMAEINAGNDEGPFNEFLDDKISPEDLDGLFSNPAKPLSTSGLEAATEFLTEINDQYIAVARAEAALIVDGWHIVIFPCLEGEASHQANCSVDELKHTYAGEIADHPYLCDWDELSELGSNAKEDAERRKTAGSSHYGKMGA